MPIARVRLPDGRTARFEVPEGTTPAQIEAFASGKLATKLEAAPPIQEVIDEMSPLQKAIVGVGKGFTDIGQGAKQLAIGAGEMLGVVPEGSGQEYTQRIMQESKEVDDPLLRQSGAARTGQVVGQAAATAPIPGGVTGGALRRIGTGALAGGAAAGLLPAESGSERLQNVAAGATGGGIGTAAMVGAGKLASGLRGNTSANRAAELGDLSRQFDVPLTVGELRGSPGFQRIEQMLERVPIVGTRGFREGQARSLAVAAEALKGRYSQAGVENVGDELQQSLSRTLSQNKQVATQLFDTVAEEAAKKGGTINLNNVKSVAKGIMGAEGMLPEGVQNSQLVKDLQTYMDLPEVNFEVARKIRSRLGQAVRQAERKQIAGSVSDEQVAAMKRIQGALEEDIAEFANKDGGRLSEVFKEANQYYRENVVPFKDRDIRKAGQETFDTDQMVMKFIKNDRPQLAAKLMNKLDPRGKAAVKYAVLEDAFQSAIEGGTNKTPFSAAKFALQIEKLGNTKNVIFDPAERLQIDGFAKLARAAERAGQYLENPPTGQRAVDFAVAAGFGGGMVFEPATAFGAATAAGTLSKLLTSAAGRRILTRAAGVPQDSKVMQRLLYQDLPRVLALEAANEKRDTRNPR